MTKRILSLLTAVLLLLLPLSVAGADGPSYWDPQSQSYLYSGACYGIVICTKMNVRDRASTSGKTLGSISNGQPVKVVGTSQDGNFYLVNLASCGIATTDPDAYGYAKSSLIKLDPEFIGTRKLVNLYATPWSTELKNGEQTNRFFLVLDRNNGWYAVQAQERGVGTAFIRSNDIGQYSGYSSMYVVTWDAQLLDEASWSPVRTVKRFSVGSLFNVSGDYSLLVFEEGTANEYRGWINTQYIAPIVN